MQNAPTGRGRRQGRPATTRSAAAAADHNATTKNDTAVVKHYTPGATLGIPAQETRPRTRLMTRATAAVEESPRATADDKKAVLKEAVATMYKNRQLTREQVDSILTGSRNMEADRLMWYLKETNAASGDERLSELLRSTNSGNAVMKQRMQTQRAAQNAVAMQQGEMANVEGVPRPVTYPQQRLMGQYGLAPNQIGHPPLTHQQPIRPLTYGQGLAPQLNRRPTEQQFMQGALGVPLNQRSVAGVPTMRGMHGGLQRGPLQGTGEVAKTLMPSQMDRPMQQYTPGGYLSPAAAQIAKSNLYASEYAQQQMPTESRGSAETVSNKRTAPQSAETSTAKAPRYNKRPVPEDPSAPDVGDMDVVAQADIQLADEQEALLNDVPTQSVSDGDGQLIESHILNVGAIKTRLLQVLRDQGMQLAGLDAVDVLTQGMEEKFEAFLMKAVKRAIHRTQTSNINRDSETKNVTSDVRSKLREIKKKQELQKANKLREEREKLEQLAETASKKELASNKELAAKVEKVKREKQFNAEAEAANRALSNALGGLGFEKYRKMKKDKEARLAAAGTTTTSTAPSSEPPSAQPPPSTSLPPSSSQPMPLPKPVPVRKYPPVEDNRPVILTVKDLVSVMSQDTSYAFSPVLYRLHL